MQSQIGRPGVGSARRECSVETAYTKGQGWPYARQISIRFSPENHTCRLLQTASSLQEKTCRWIHRVKGNWAAEFPIWNPAQNLILPCSVEIRLSSICLTCQGKPISPKTPVQIYEVIWIILYCSSLRPYTRPSSFITGYFGTLILSADG